MALLDLVIEVAARLRSQPSVAINADGFYRAMGNRNVPFNRTTANHVASAIIAANAARCASVETFEPDKGQEQFYMIAANSMDAYDAAVREIQQRVIAMAGKPAQIVVRVITDFPER